MTSPATSNEQPTSVWRNWWTRLQQDRGGRAELARCGTVTEAAFCAPFHLLRRMKGNPEGEMELKNLALIAAVLSHVDNDDPGAGSLATQMATPDGGKAVVSDTRFRQLLRTEAGDLDERLLALVRVLRQLSGRASVHELANDLSWWNERTKRKWALDYYEHAPEPGKADV